MEICAKIDGKVEGGLIRKTTSRAFGLNPLPNFPILTGIVITLAFGESPFTIAFCIKLVESLSSVMRKYLVFEELSSYNAKRPRAVACLSIPG